MTIPTIPTIPTKFQLLFAFGARSEVRVKLKRINGSVFMTGVISSLQHEDGSGESFNAKICESGTGNYVTVYLGRLQ